MIGRKAAALWTCPGRQRPQPREGRDQRLGPRPGARQAQGRAPGRAHDPSRRRAGGAGAAAWARRGRARPSRQSSGVQASRSWAISESSSQTRLCSKAAKGRLRMPGVLAAADRVLDAGAAAVAQLQGGDVGALLVGDEGGVAVAVGVEDLRTARRGAAARGARSAACPRASARGRRRSVSSATQAPSRSVPSASIALCHADSGSAQDRLAHPLVDLVADREADAGRRGSPE